MMVIPPPTKQDLEAWLNRIRDPEHRQMMVEYLKELQKIMEESRLFPPPPPPSIKGLEPREIPAFKCIECGSVDTRPDNHIAEKGHTKGFIKIKIPIKVKEEVVE